MKKQKNKLQKLVESIIRDLICCTFISAALSIVASFTRSHMLPVIVNSNYMEEVAAGGTGAVATTAGSSFAAFGYYASLILVILVCAIFVTKTIMRVHEYLNDKKDQNEKAN